MLQPWLLSPFVGSFKMHQEKKRQRKMTKATKSNSCIFVLSHFSNKHGDTNKITQLDSKRTSKHKRHLNVSSNFPIISFVVVRGLLKNDSTGLSSVLSYEPRPGQESSSKGRERDRCRGNGGMS